MLTKLNWWYEKWQKITEEGKNEGQHGNWIEANKKAEIFLTRIKLGNKEQKLAKRKMKESNAFRIDK